MKGLCYEKRLLISVAFITLFTTSAQAQNTSKYGNPDKPSAYVVGRFAFSSTDGSVKDEAGEKHGDFDIGNGGLDVGIGFKPDDIFRAELTYNYRGGGENEQDTYGGISGYQSHKYDLTSSAFMLNGYIDIPVSSKIKPYIGAGIGFANVEYSIEHESMWWGKQKEKASSIEFSYSFVAGVGFETNEQITWDFGYRYVDFGSFKKNGYKFDTSANEVLLGVRYSF